MQVKGVVMSVGVAFLVVLSVMRLTRLTILDKITDKLMLAMVNMLSFWDWGQEWFRKLVTCSWCMSLWWGAVVSPIGYYWGDTPWFVIGAMALVASQFTGLTSQWLDPGRRDWADD